MVSSYTYLGLNRRMVEMVRWSACDNRRNIKSGPARDAHPHSLFRNTQTAAVKN